jgi:hypothetical protein
MTAGMGRPGVSKYTRQVKQDEDWSSRNAGMNTRSVSYVTAQAIHPLRWFHTIVQVVSYHISLQGVVDESMNQMFGKAAISMCHHDNTAHLHK